MEDKEPEVERHVAEPAEEAGDSVKKGGFAIFALIVLSLCWYLFADRCTPYTSQARVQGYVVGVAPKVDGLVTEVWVENNQHVQKEDKLFQIDRSSYEIALSRAESDYENAQNRVRAGDAGVLSAEANLISAIANRTKAEKDMNRLKRLYESDSGTISVRRLEISEASLDQAKANVVAAEAEIARVIEQNGGRDIRNNSILLSAQSAVEKANLDLRNTLVVASSSGVITDLRADVGFFASRGNPVMTLVPIEDVWVNAEFTENNLGHLNKDVAVEILFDALPGKVFQGRVDSIGLGVSTGQENKVGSLPTIQNSRDWLRQSQRFPVRIVFDIEQDSAMGRQLRVGGQASVMAYTGQSSVLEVLGRAYMRMMSFASYVY